MTDGTTSTPTSLPVQLKLAEHPFRKGKHAGSIPVAGSIMAVLFAIALACTPVNYAKALDQCAFEHAGDRAATVACQCDVAQQYGRDCKFLQTDAAVAPVDAPKE